MGEDFSTTLEKVPHAQLEKIDELLGSFLRIFPEFFEKFGIGKNFIQELIFTLQSDFISARKAKKFIQRKKHFF